MPENYRILVVDDDFAIVNIIETALKAAGYGVLTAHDGERACALAASEAPHLIIMDVMMPRCNGILATMRIREHLNVPILMLSAKAEGSDRVLGLEAGADDMQADEDVFEITTDPDAFNDVVAALEAKGYTFLEAEVRMVPQNYVTLTNEEDIKNMEKLIEMLEDNDDVQNVYHNWDQD